MFFFNSNISRAKASKSKKRKNMKTKPKLKNNMKTGMHVMRY